MGEKQNQPFELSFNSSLKVDFQGSRVTSDGGLFLGRWRHRTLKTRLAIAFRGGQVYVVGWVGGHIGNSGLLPAKG
jgi:hypothetical protein